MKKYLFFLAVCSILFSVKSNAENKHSKTTLYTTYKGLVMAGYQGWFHQPKQGVMYPDARHIHIDMWPDVKEYAKTYPTGMKLSDGSIARFFDSADKSTVDLHFKWMQQYGIDGVFMQRFFGAAQPSQRHSASTKVLTNAFAAASKYKRAIAIMYDLSGLKKSGQDCSSLIEDWKYLVDSLPVTNQQGTHTYLFYNGKPLVVIWGLGFPDRPYNIRDIGIQWFMNFLKNDPEYGLSVMLNYNQFFKADFELSFEKEKKTSEDGKITITVKVKNAGNMTDVGKLSMYVDGVRQEEIHHFELAPEKKKLIRFELEGQPLKNITVASKYKSISLNF